MSGLPKCQISRLQKMQNRAARLITRTKLVDHIQPVQKRLHWLPISSCIQFKTLTFAYKCNNDNAPIYLQELLSEYKPTRALRARPSSTFHVTILILAQGLFLIMHLHYGIPFLTIFGLPELWRSSRVSSRPIFFRQSFNLPV